MGSSAWDYEREGDGGAGRDMDYSASWRTRQRRRVTRAWRVQGTAELTETTDSLRASCRTGVGPSHRCGVKIELPRLLARP